MQFPHGSPTMTTLLIADDHPLFREALRGAVQQVIPGVQLFEADSVEALLHWPTSTTTPTWS